MEPPLTLRFATPGVGLIGRIVFMTASIIDEIPANRRYPLSILERGSDDVPDV
jgi:hypothetical protein